MAFRRFWRMAVSLWWVLYRCMVQYRDNGGVLKLHNVGVGVMWQIYCTKQTCWNEAQAMTDSPTGKNGRRLQLTRDCMRCVN